MLKNKKSSLNLSINAIVILILAITMLGLGLTFMRGLFKQATGKVEAAVSSQELANPPTVDNPLTLYPSTQSLRKKEQGKILLAFMHAEGADRDCYLSIIDVRDRKVDPGEDTRDDGSIPKIGAYYYFMTYNDLKVENIPADKIYTWAITIDPDDDIAVPTGTGAYLCGELRQDIDATNCDALTTPCGSTCDTVGPHIYTVKIECYATTTTTPVTGTYKKDLLVKITS